jgi:cell division protein FtsB
MPQTSPAAQPQQQAPFGASPATGPTPNKGFEAAAAQRLGLVIKQLEELIPMAGATSEMGKAVLEALNKLVKYVPAGSVNPAQQKNQIESMAQKNAQQNQQMQALKQQRMQGGQGGDQGAAQQPPGQQAA